MKVWVAGAGLSGCEAAYQLLRRGYQVDLYEMRPQKMTIAHQTDLWGELVCSNSLGADGLCVGGLLKEELRRCDSLIMQAADRCSVPAGKALAVDRQAFASILTERLRCFEGLHFIQKELTTLPQGPGILATGPVTSEPLAQELLSILGEQCLAFYDAVAPVVEDCSLDHEKLYRKDRRCEGEGDYLNCPLDKDQYEHFVAQLLSAERAPLHDFEKAEYFEGCMPIEVIASRGLDTLRFGPMRPVGLERPDGSRPYAVVQLRRENMAASAWNLVGFQTNLKWKEQARVFRMLPGFENANFFRYGVMHRNIFLNAPKVLNDLELNQRPDCWVAGQLTGVEGYVESVAMGLVAALAFHGRQVGASVQWPEETAIGALLAHLRREKSHFQPMNMNRGLFPPIEGRWKRKDRPQKDKALIERARTSFDDQVKPFLK